jgi:hypothetical protein
MTTTPHEPAPSPWAIQTIALAVDEFLDACDQYHGLDVDPDEGAAAVFPRRFVLHALWRLEKLLNPSRQPFDPKTKQYPAGWLTVATSGLPTKVVTGLHIVKQYVARIIER